MVVFFIRCQVGFWVRLKEASSCYSYHPQLSPYKHLRKGLISTNHSSERRGLYHQFYHCNCTTAAAVCTNSNEITE